MSNAMVGTFILGLVGYETRWACNGLVALQMLNESRFDAMVCDLFMPERQGLETIRDVRKLYPAMGIVVASGGFGTTEVSLWLKTALALGAVAALAKPVSSGDSHERGTKGGYGATRKNSYGMLTGGLLGRDSHESLPTVLRADGPQPCAKVRRFDRGRNSTARRRRKRKDRGSRGPREQRESLDSAWRTYLLARVAISLAQPFPSSQWRPPQAKSTDQNPSEILVT